MKPWKCKTTDNTDVHRKYCAEMRVWDRDIEKFSQFVETANGIEVGNAKANAQLKKNIDAEKQRMRQVVYVLSCLSSSGRKECNDHIARLEQHEKEIIDERLPEYANYLVSMFNKNLDNIKSLANAQ